MKKLKKVFIWSSLFLTVFIFNGCLTSSNVTKVNNSITDAYSAYKVVLSSASLNNYELKYSLKYEGAKNYSFTGLIKSSGDSLIWMNIVSKTLGIEVFRAQFKIDSLFFIDKVNKKYYAGTYSYLNKLSGFGFDFNFIKSLFNGVPAGIDFVCSDSMYKMFVTKELDNNFIYSYSMLTSDKEFYSKLKSPFIAYNFKVNNGGNLTESVYLDSNSKKSLKINFTDYDKKNLLNGFNISIKSDSQEHNLLFNVLSRTSEFSDIKYKVPSSYISY